MIRAFLALPLPRAIASELVLLQYRLPQLPRPVLPENFHITLVFLGDCTPGVLEELHLALSALRNPALSLQLQGLGLFGGERPRNLHATLAPAPELHHLQAKLAQMTREVGIDLPARRFKPHVTLARFRTGEQLDPRLGHAIAEGNRFASPVFTVPELVLYRSILRRDGAVYDPLAEYPLGEHQLLPEAKS